jgi:carbonic anhydrase
MQLIKHLLPLILVGSTLGAFGAEEPKKAPTREASNKRPARTNYGKDSEKKKPAEKALGPTGKATPGEGGQSAGARLKALESENARLRLELAAKGTAAAVAPGAEAATPEGALAELQAGNSRFVLGARTRSQLGVNDPALRQALAKGQAPFAIIVTCSDSRLGENYIFDQELGRLFTVREAGNCPDIQGLASIEYAVEHLGSKLVVVMGHDSCGAVKAVKDSGPAILPGNLWSLQAGMTGLLESVHPEAGESAATHLGRLVQSNAERQARIVLGRSAIVQHLCASGKLKVVPAVYDLSSGQVKFLAPVGAEPATPAHH